MRKPISDTKRKFFECLNRHDERKAQPLSKIHSPSPASTTQAAIAPIPFPGKIPFALPRPGPYTMIAMKHFPASNRILLPTFLPLLTALLLASGNAEDWERVGSKDGKVSALFPVNIKENVQTQTDKTLAGKVTSYYGEYYGDGLVLAGSGADIPMLARAAGNSPIFDGSKKTFLEQAEGTEISFKEITVGGAPAGELIYKGDAYQGKGDPYEGRARFIIVNKRMYVLNAVISKPTAENKAAAEKLLNSVEINE